jgi:hypothetical protein
MVVDSVVDLVVDSFEKNSRLPEGRAEMPGFRLLQKGDR